MRLSLVSPHLLVFISVLSLSRAQNITETTTASPTNQTETTFTTETSTTATTTPPWTAPAIFYPFGSAAGDTETIVAGAELYTNVPFTTPFSFFGRGYNSIFINNNGLLTFNQQLEEANPPQFPTYGNADYIAALWTELDDVGYGRYWYQEYTSGSVLARAAQDINQYFPNRGFTVFWVFVVTWDYVLTSDMNVLNQHSAPAITFQAVLIGGHGFSFMLMNYGDCAGINFPVEAGYDTVGSTDYYVIHYDQNSAYNIPTLKTTTNVNVPGRWAFLVNNGTENFYPFGPAAGDTESIETGGESYANFGFSTPFGFFGRGYNSIYINNNGLLTFNHPLTEAHPSPFPTYGNEDYIAALWTELDDFGYGRYWYHEYTNGSVLARATQDINQYFPNMGFTASWVFVVTWDYVQTSDMNVLNEHSAPAITFQAVLIGGYDISFILMNYGECSGIVYPVEAGYDTIGSTDYHVIYYLYNGYNIQILKNMTNVDTPGRWAFLVNNGTVTLQTTTAPTTTPAPWTAPAIFYPFGSAAGDTVHLENAGDTYVNVAFSTPFTFFGRKYNSVYVNNNGLLTFKQPLPEAHPYQFPSYGNDDYIAALWTELDDYGLGRYSYQEYTSGSVLARAAQDINQYFPNMGFTASWVFVVTWDYVQTSDMNVLNQHSAPAITFQAVLIGGHGFSFILMSYGDCAGIVYPAEAGYDTIGSTDYFVIHYDYPNGYNIPNLKGTSNVGVSGRWAFLVNNGTAIFYPFGSTAGDTGTLENESEGYINVAFSTPFTFFGRGYNSIYINNIGLLTFKQPINEGYPPYWFPTHGNEDYIAPLWSDIDDLGIGRYWYHEYTSGSVLARATQDIKEHFFNRGFTASWVFVVTWDYVLTFDPNKFYRHEGPAVTFQAVLISGRDNSSYVLMNYGECAGIYYQGQAGYDTIGSTDYYVIHSDSNSGYSFADIKNTTNVNVPGRWAFYVNNGTETILGVQIKVTSFDDLTQSGNIEDVLQKIKNVLVSRGASSNFEVKLRKVQKINP